MNTSFNYYILLESTGGHEESDKLRFEGALEEAFKSGLIVDAVIAQSKQQGEDLWAIRDDIENMTKKLSPSIVFDISLGIPKMADYVDEVRKQITGRWPASQMVVFGHLGDGNIHLVVTVGSLVPEEVHIALMKTLKKALDPKGILNPGKIFEDRDSFL